MAEEVALIFEARTQDLVTADNRLNKLNKTGKETTRVQGQLGNAFSRNNSAIQNTAFQLQDIVVQLEAGVPVTRTLGQQLPQLLGGFGALGAVAGVVAGLGFALGGVLLSAFNDTRTAADRLKEALEELDNVASITDLGVIQLSDSLQKLRQRSEQAFQASLLEGINDAKDAIRASRDSVVDLIEAFNVGDLGSRIDPFFLNVTRLNSAFKLGQITLQDYRSRVDELFLSNTKASKGFREFREGVVDASEQSLLAFNTLQKLRQEQDGYTDSINKNQASIDRLITNLQIQAEAANDAANGTAFYRAEQLGATSAELARVQSLQQLIDKQKEAEREAAAAARAAELARVQSLQQLKESEREAAAAARAAESAAESENRRVIAFQNRLFATEDFLRSETQAYRDSYNERQSILDAALKKGLITEEENRKLSAQNELVYQQQRLSQYSGFLSQFSALASSENNKLFEIGKAANIARATIDGISAAISSYKFGADIGGPVVGALFASASAAATGALIGQMAAARPPGRAQGGMVRPGQAYKVGEFGEEVFVPSSAGKIVPNQTNNYISNSSDQMPIKIEIINNGSGSRVTSTTFADRVVRVFLQDIEQDGEISQAGQQRMSWKRRV